LSDRQFVAPEKDTMNFPSASELSLLMRLDPWQENLDFKSLFREVAVEQLMLLLSNGGWREHEPFKQGEDGGDGSDPGLLAGKKLKRVAPFRIFFEMKGDDYLLVFARGEKIVLGRCEAFVRIIESVNSDEVLSVDELSDSIPDEAVRNASLSLLSVLYHYRSITIIE